MKERLVISYGKGRDFEAGLNRLKMGMKANDSSTCVGIFYDLPEGCPDHTEVPYAFKPFLCDKARQDGMKQVIWMDASCVPVRPLGRLWYELERDGCLFQASPLPIGEWCSDAVLESMGVTREQAMAMKPSIWACVVGLDFRHAKANDFLDRWLAKSRDGISFPGYWTNERGQCSKDPRVKGHRFDQSVATILAYQLGMPFNLHVVAYDATNVMPLEPTESQLRLPWFRTYILSNHNAKGYERPREQTGTKGPCVLSVCETMP